jgi:hypothetical protein
LKPFANTPFTLSVNPSKTRFMEALYNVLISAGWVWKKPTVKPPPGRRSVVPLIHGKAAINSEDGGVTIEVAQERLEQFEPAGAALAKALTNDANIPVECKAFPEAALSDADVIDIRIARRDE